MKKLFLGIVALMAAASMSAHSAGEKFLKPMVGGTMSTITKADNAKMRLGLVAGGELGYFMADNLALTGGLLVSLQGANFDDTNYTRDMSSTMTYLNIPVLANYYVAPGLAIKAGLQPGFLLANNDKGEYNNGGKWVEYDESSTDGMKKFDLSIPIGLSYEISDFVIDARYNFGVTKIAEHGDSKNSVIMLTLGYKIPF